MISLAAKFSTDAERWTTRCDRSYPDANAAADVAAAAATVRYYGSLAMACSTTLVYSNLCKKKTVQFIETLYKGDIVVRDIKQQRSIFHHYKISNFTVTHIEETLLSADNVRALSYLAVKLFSKNSNLCDQ